jgi:serine phosphatase RsbU (regulator of sigma subunit)
MKTIYINCKTAQGIETIDAFFYSNKEQRIYAKQMLKEYNMALGGCYLSSRCTKEWRNK